MTLLDPDAAALSACRRGQRRAWREAQPGLWDECLATFGEATFRHYGYGGGAANEGCHCHF